MRLHWLLDETAGSIRRIRRRGWNYLHLVLILAVGLGCVTGIFDVAYGVLHTPLPCPDPDRIAVADNAYTGRLLFAYNRPNPSLGTVFERAAEYRFLDANLDSGQDPRRIQVAMVSPQFFPTLGIRISMGHDFSGTDSFPVPTSQPHWLPIILGHELWRTYFASNETILNHSIELSIPPYHYQVIGVAPADVSFPSGVDAWVPVHLTSFSTIQTAGVTAGSGGVIGLLKPGLSMAAAEAAIRTWPKQRLFDSGVDGTVKLISLRDFRAGEIYLLGLKLWLASIFFLILIIIAAATVFQTEVAVRRDEFAIRSALGASSGRLFVALSLETGLVVLLSLIASFPVRTVLIHVTATYLPLPKGFHSGIHGIDLAMGAGAAGIAWIVSLLIQGTHLWRSLPLFSIVELLRSESVKTHSKSRIVSRYRLPVQIIPATVILIVAALLARSAYNTMHINPSVQTGGVFVCEVSFATDSDRFAATRISSKMSQAEREKAYTASSRLFHEQMNLYISEIINNLTKSPGVIQAGAISTAPYRGHQPLGFEVQSSSTPDVSPSADVIRWVISRSITPGLIPALGIGLVHGRNFSPRGAEDANTIIINEALAGKLGHGTNALGRYVKFTGLPAARVVGIVSNVREQTLFSEVWPTAYFPFSEWGLSDIDLVVRTSPGVSSRDALHLIQTSVRSISPKAAVSHFEALSEMVESAGTLARYTAYYLLALAVLSIFLAGFCASSKTLGEFHRRKREIGIRMALGATRGDIIGLFVYSDLARSVIAALFGAMLAWWFSHLLNYLLYDVKLVDPMSYSIGITTLLGSIAIVQILLLKKALQKNPSDLI